MASRYYLTTWAENMLSTTAGAHVVEKIGERFRCWHPWGATDYELTRSGSYRKLLSDGLFS